MDIDGDVSPLIVDIITDVSLNFFLRVCALKVNSGLPCLKVFIESVSFAKLQ